MPNADSAAAHMCNQMVPQIRENELMEKSTKLDDWIMQATQYLQLVPRHRFTVPLRDDIDAFIETMSRERANIVAKLRITNPYTRTTEIMKLEPAVDREQERWFTRIERESLNFIGDADRMRTSERR